MSESFSKTVSSSDVVGFAEVTGDRNPIHLSEHFAARTTFGTRIAHGLYTASLISALLGTRLPGTRSDLHLADPELPRSGADRRHGDGRRHRRRTGPREVTRPAALHLQGRRRRRARWRSARESALEGRVEAAWADMTGRRLDNASGSAARTISNGLEKSDAHGPGRRSSDRRAFFRDPDRHNRKAGRRRPQAHELFRALQCVNQINAADRGSHDWPLSEHRRIVVLMSSGRHARKPAGTGEENESK